LGLADLPCRGKANPAPTHLECCGIRRATWGQKACAVLKFLLSEFGFTRSQARQM
jgi:hypothetical protein